MEQKRPTMPVPAAGQKYYGLGRNASYAAAKRGDIPTINIGGRIFAIVPLIERQLGLLSNDQAPGSLSDGARKSAPPPTDLSDDDTGEKTSSTPKSRFSIPE